MSSNNSASTAETPALDLQLGHSVLALKLIFLLHVGPVVLLPFAMQQGTPMLVILAGFMLSWLALRRHPVFGFGAKALTRLTWHGDGHWTLHDSLGSYEADLLPSSIIHPKLLVLNFKLKDGARRARAVLGDEAEAEPLRRLRVRLNVAG